MIGSVAVIKIKVNDESTQSWMHHDPSVHHDPSPECAPMRSECAWGVIQRSEIYNLVLESIFTRAT